MTTLLDQFKDCPLGFGGASISGEGGGYGFGDMSEGEACDLLNYAFEKNVRLFDTAPIYGFGLSEKRIGKAFKDKREKVFIVSKCGITWHSSKRVNLTNDPKVAQEMLEQSLRDLNTDYIDLYMIHWPDPQIDIRASLEVLAKAQIKQKIKHIGLCNTTIEDLEKSKEVAKIETVQAQFNLFETGLKGAFFDYLKIHQIDFMSWGTMDKGIIAGTVTKERRFESSDARSWAPWWKNADFSWKLKAMEEIKPLLHKENLSPTELPLLFNLSYTPIKVVLCGSRSFSQLDQTLNAFSKSLNPELKNKIEKIVDSHRPKM